MLLGLISNNIVSFIYLISITHNPYPSGCLDPGIGAPTRSGRRAFGDYGRSTHIWPFQW